MLSYEAMSTMRPNALQNDLLRAPFATGRKLLFRVAQGVCSKRTLHGTPVRAAKRGKGESGGGRSSGPLYITVERDGSDLWRLDPVINMLKEGALGILPTDTYPALVCDIEARKAVERLYAAKGMEPTKQLSILVRNFSDINTYTLGFPSTGMGQDTFRLARRALPGPYTLILHASKAMPKQCVDFLTGKSKPRRTVGVRMPGDALCQAVLANLDRPLLSTSVHVEAEGELEIPEGAVMMDMFAGRGLDFVVDCGTRVAEGSTVIDLTEREPTLIRQGKGDPSIFVSEHAYA
ncbi:Uncharacterized protein YciO [Coccomyxa sp. Obi]|nr:Uncharacterized protein YciO [Coccomyxa sp. Obi]